MNSSSPVIKIEVRRANPDDAPVAVARIKTQESLAPLWAIKRDTILSMAARRDRDGQGERNERYGEVARAGLASTRSQQREIGRYLCHRLPTENPDQERGKNRMWLQPGQDRPMLTDRPGPGAVPGKGEPRIRTLSDEEKYLNSSGSEKPQRIRVRLLPSLFESRGADLRMRE